ncbi:MAG: hypothetical protein ACREDR_37650, partial [Blastocatellia bacterium]
SRSNANAQQALPKIRDRGTEFVNEHGTIIVVLFSRFLFGAAQSRDPPGFNPQSHDQLAYSC